MIAWYVHKLFFDGRPIISSSLYICKFITSQQQLLFLQPESNDGKYVCTESVI